MWVRPLWFSALHILCCHCVDGTFPSIICEYEEEEFDDYEQQILGCNRLQYAIIEQNERVCYNQIIYSDGRLESEEYAGLKLKVKEMTAVTDIKQETTYIKIIDNDSKLCKRYIH